MSFPTAPSWLVAADRLFDGTGTATVLRPVVRIAGKHIQAVQRSLLTPTICSGERCIPTRGCG